MSDARRIKVLALSPQPIEGAGCRFRIAQFIPYLEQHGFDVDLHTLYSREFFNNQVYEDLPLRVKARAFAPLMASHLWKLRKLWDYDVVFIYREMLPVGPAVVEWLMALPGCPPIVFDFDDAIYMPSTNATNWRIRRFKLNKVPAIVRRSRRVVVGNEFLATYARQFNTAVEVIPTSVDTEQFAPLPPSPSPAGRPLVLGWIGSPTTAEYIEQLAPALQALAKRHPFVLRVSGASKPVTIPGVTVENPAWRLAGEVDLFRTCDIGVYPLKNDEWAKGKCGFKAIAFMACGVPVVASAVGANCEIIQDGVNGFLARTDDEFVGRLSRLIEDEGLRRRLSVEGRRTVEEHYSLHVNAPRLAEILRQTAESRR